MKPTPIGVFRCYPDTRRVNLPNLKYQRFGQRAYTRRLRSCNDLRPAIQDMKRRGFVYFH